jgi:hypothetical protein
MVLLPAALLRTYSQGASSLADCSVAPPDTTVVPPGILLALACDDRQRSYHRQCPVNREGVMGELTHVCELTTEERHLIGLLRQGPQSVQGLAKALRISPDQTQDVLQSLNRKVGIVPLFRFDTLRYGLAE